MNIIEVENVSKTFGDKKVLNNISFTVKKGEILGLIGLSGAGKTTMINILLGLTDRDSGICKILDTDSRNLNKNIFKKIGIMGPNIGFYKNTSIYNNILLSARVANVSNDYADNLLRMVNLYDRRFDMMKDISSGMWQRISFIRSIINNPDILFLDEPTSNLDPITSKVIRNKIRELSKNGTTIVLASHNMQEVSELCSDVKFLYKGNFIEQGSARKIIQKYMRSQNVIIEYRDGHTEKMPFSKITEIKNAYSIHSEEPSLEQIFIELIGNDLKE